MVADGTMTPLDAADWPLDRDVIDDEIPRDIFFASTSSVELCAERHDASAIDDAGVIEPSLVDAVKLFAPYDDAGDTDALGDSVALPGTFV